MPEGGKFRAKASAALGGTAGAWGDGDLLCVDFDANGELIVNAAVGTAKGVIYTPEGRRDSTVATFKQVIAGKVYTVLTFAEIQEMANSTSPVFAAGDPVYAAAGGDVTNASAVGAIYLGQILPDDTVPGGAGLKLVLNVNGAPVGA
jgi:hypothetical protein